MAEDGEEKNQIPSLPVDLFGEVLSHLSLAELLPALSVSSAFRAAAYLSAASRRRPWLLVHAQRRRISGDLATHAYDPHSASWLKFPPLQLPSSAVGTVAGTDFLFHLTPAALAVGGGSRHLRWRRVGAPLAWRRDPVVAAEGSLLVVAGGGLDGDSCAVEVHHLDGSGGAAAAAKPMPEAFRASAAATFLSAAAGGGKVHVIDRSSGMFCSFDVVTRKWGPTKDLQPDPSLSFCAIAYSEEGLLLAGVGRRADRTASLRVWAVNEDNLSCTLVGEMPERMAQKLVGAEEDEVSSIDVVAGGDLVYVYRPGDPTAVFAGEFAGGECRWRELGVPAAVVANHPMDRFVLTCSMVGIDDLRAALRESGHVQSIRSFDKW